jgi:hypothetical protein
MTFLGKIVVLVNVVVCVVLLGMTAAVVGGRVDWSSAKPAEGKPAGVLAQRDARFKELCGALVAAENRFRTARQQLYLVENQRPLDRQWYDKEIAELLSGKDGNTKTQVKFVVTKDGLPVLNPQDFNRPLLQPALDRAGQPLFSSAYYAEALLATHNSITDEQQRYQKALDEDARLADQIIGPKGLRAVIALEQAKRASVEQEYKDLEPRLTNSQVDTYLLKERQEQLEKRVEELKKATGAAAHKP